MQGKPWTKRQPWSEMQNGDCIDGAAPIVDAAEVQFDKVVDSGHSDGFGHRIKEVGRALVKVTSA